jgi:hypothetical protein
VKDVGEPCAGEPHARFDGEGLETEQELPRQPLTQPTSFLPLLSVAGKRHQVPGHEPDTDQLTPAAKGIDLLCVHGRGSIVDIPKLVLACC